MKPKNDALTFSVKVGKGDNVFHIDLNRGEPNSDCGGVVLCTIYKNDSDCFLTLSLTVCSKDDVFDLMTGRKIALRRALLDIRSKGIRERVWKEFHLACAEECKS